MPPWCLRRVLPLLLLPLPLAAQSADPAATGSQVAALQQVEDSWDAAVTKHDQFALENMLSPQFVGIDANGTITTRDQQIAHLFVAGAEPASLKQKVIDARVLGDVAVVNGTYVMDWKDATAQVAEKGVFTHVFRRNGAGRWVCINSQRTVVVTEDERKKVAARTQTKSNAPLPLHIPLVYSGPKSTQPAPPPSADQPQ